jgi:NAD-dependent histone deacetylase SIR2
MAAAFIFNSEPSSPLTELSDSDVPFPSSPPPQCALQSLPSPSSSRRSSAKTSPAPEDMPSPPSSNDDDPPPAKRRKLTDPKERTTEYLDLTTDITDEEKPQLQRLLNVLHKKRKIVVIAGAGISVSAGIPDFRSATGLFNSLKKEHKLKSSGKDLFDASVYQDDRSTSTFHDMVRTLSTETKGAQPTAFHHLLATLAQEGRLMRLYTQNVDGIDTSLPPLKTQAPLPKKAPWPKTVQVHGGLDHMVCSKCHTLYPFDAKLFEGPTPPPCPDCVTNDEVRQVASKRSHGIGRLRPRMVLYNEHNPDDEAIGSCATTDIRLRPDAVIVAGTTLKVPGVRRIAREMCNTVRDRRDGVAIWINNDPEPLGKDLENAWDLVIKGPCDEVARHAALPKWNDPMDYKEITEAEMSKLKDNKKVEVVVGTPKKPSVLRNAGHLTPGQSPRMRPNTAINEEPTTPSKKGTKRKSGAQMNLLGTIATKTAAKKAQAQPKKPVGRPRTKKSDQKETPAINHVFKASKAASKAVGKPAAKNSEPSVRIAQTKAAPIINSGKTDDTSKAHPATPKHVRVTRFKPTLVMGPLSDADPRNNQQPERPEIESFTPVKPRTPSDQIHEELALACATSPTTGSRPSSSGSHRDQIVRPESVPHGMGHIVL